MINNLNVKEYVSKSYSKINIQKQTLDFFGQGFYNGRKYIFMKPLSKIKHQVNSGKYYILPRRNNGGYMPMDNPDDYIIWESLD